jgi:Zn-finger nucleic acid-binding protein
MPDAPAQRLQCPGCGAPADAASARCDYCRARLATVSCPACFGLLFDGAGFCQHCGAKRQREEAGGAAIRCPACRAAMAWVRVGQTDLLECERCDATWVEAETFERICADREAQGAVLHTAPRHGAPYASPPEPTIRYRPCPRCAKLMNRVNFGRVSGTVVDVCKGHGTFLDRGELHAIVRFIQGGGLEKTRAREREDIAEERRRLNELLLALRVSRDTL